MQTQGIRENHKRRPGKFTLSALDPRDLCLGQVHLVRKLVLLPPFSLAGFSDDFTQRHLRPWQIPVR